MSVEQQYLNIMREILDQGVQKHDRTGVGTWSLFGRSIIHDFSYGFPLLTTKKMFVRGIIGELLWFLMGTEDASFLIKNKIHIWDEWMQNGIDGKKILLHTYGVKWRNFDGIDQVQNVIDSIKTTPYSRRHLVTAWDPRSIQEAALPWCHVLYQLYCVKDEDLRDPPNDQKNGELSMSVYQRSADFFLGVPFNIASYSFLLYMICELTGYRPGKLFYSFGDCHIYTNHVDQVRGQLKRVPYDLPQLKIKHQDNINDFGFDDFEIVGYKYHPAIKGKVAV